ncbi:MAG: ATP-dependent helicase, RecQ family, partial [Solirubrobacterales bacterium]|nr:ATP-dependent helicase, RecQ family [Solirubrobacterales bacterium]
ASGLAAGRLDDETLDGLADLVRTWGIRPAWLTWIPSRTNEAALADAAARLGAALGIDVVGTLERTAVDAPPQREMANAAQQVANVRGAFAVRNGGVVPDGPALLLDDRRQSGWTLAMIGGQLRGKGASAVYPLALASAM